MEARTTVSMCRERPDYAGLARALLPAIQGFFAEPENQRAFEEWKERREGNDQRKKAAGA